MAIDKEKRRIRLMGKCQLVAALLTVSFISIDHSLENATVQIMAHTRLNRSRHSHWTIRQRKIESHSWWRPDQEIGSIDDGCRIRPCRKCRALRCWAWVHSGTGLVTRVRNSACNDTQLQLFAHRILADQGANEGCWSWSAWSHCCSVGESHQSINRSCQCLDTRSTCLHCHVTPDWGRRRAHWVEGILDVLRTVPPRHQHRG